MVAPWDAEPATVTMDPGDDIPTVHLGLTYVPEDDAPPPIRYAGIPAWFVLVGVVGWGLWKWGGTFDV